MKLSRFAIILSIVWTILTAIRAMASHEQDPAAQGKVFGTPYTLEKSSGK